MVSRPIRSKSLNYHDYDKDYEVYRVFERRFIKTRWKFGYEARSLASVNPR